MKKRRGARRARPLDSEPPVRSIEADDEPMATDEVTIPAHQEGFGRAERVVGEVSGEVREELDAVREQEIRRRRP